MPSDVVGTNVLVMDAAQRAAGSMFAVQTGPIFGQIVLADEINRATPKTQSALLEAMAEHAVTIAGTAPCCSRSRSSCSRPRTRSRWRARIPLPEAQLDRFLLKVVVPNPSEDELCDGARAHDGARAGRAAARAGPRRGARAARLCRDVAVAEPVARYAARLVRASDPSAARGARDW